MSSFGLSALPPSTPWYTPQQMLHECLHDLNNPAVRTHLLGHDLSTDMTALTIPSNRVQARIFSGEVDTERTQGFEKTNAVHEQIFLPVWRDEHITAGVMVESNIGQGAVSQIFSHPSRYARYVSNEKRSSNLMVYEGGDQIEMYYATCREGWRMFAMTWMSRELFANALSTPTVDTCVALQALTKTIVGAVKCGPNVRGNIDCVQSQANHELVGGHLFQNVLALYAHSEPLLTVPIFANASYGLTLAHDVVQELRKRGLLHRVHNFATTPSAMPSANAIATAVLPPNNHPNFAPIAPSPTTLSTSTITSTTNPGDDDDLDPQILLLRRAQRRRIQNRITAARSNEKRRQARRAALQAS